MANQHQGSGIPRFVGDVKTKKENDPNFIKLDMINENIRYLEEQLDVFQGVKGGEEYKLLEDEFNQKLLALDSINTKGSVMPVL